MKIPDNRANGFEEGSKATNNRLVKHNPTSATAQCTRLLSRLKQGPITTYEAMRMLDVYHVPARVLQLRKRGNLIQTIWKRFQTESGEWHKVGEYVLIETAENLRLKHAVQGVQRNKAA